MKKHWDKNTGIHTQIGLILSLGFALLAFEWKSYDDPSLVCLLGKNQTEFEEIIELPVLHQTTPPPPIKVMPTIVEVKDTEPIEEQITEIIFEATDNMPTIEPFIEPDAAPVDDEVETVFVIVEEPTAPVGGMKAFYEYIKENLEYPRQARRMGVQGKVFLEFVVDKDGSLTEIKVVRGIGAGCDEEAMRILKNAPKWKPGKQRGQAVKQRLTFPLNFVLN